MSDMGASDLRPRIGVSGCLLGDRVRYDGKGKKHDFLLETLGKHVEWVRVCPEVELGLGVPRPKIHLVEDVPGQVRMLQGDRDLTDDMRSMAQARVRDLQQSELHGYVTKSRSPSCGETGVEVLRNGTSKRDGTGLFIRELRSQHRSLPICEETDLEDPQRRESMMASIFLLHRWRHRGDGVAGLQGFHRRHHLFLIWRGAEEPEQWGSRFQAASGSLSEIEDGYLAWMMDHVQRPITMENLRRVEESSGARVALEGTLGEMHHQIRSHLFAERPDLRPDRFFDPYPPDLA